MRRSFALAIASLFLGSGSLLFAAQGCSTTALGVQDLCGWIADECNCYRRFAAGVAPTGAAPLCGARIEGDNAVDGSGLAYNPQTSKPTAGKFLKRDKLDLCVLSGATGGNIKFDPALDVNAFPPANFGFKIVDGTGKECGSGSYAGENSFSISFPAPEGTGGAGGSTGGAGGSTGGAGGSTAGVSCREATEKDPATEAITYGTFTIAGTDVANVVTTTCPNEEEQHRFNLLQLDKCDGTAEEHDYKALMPRAEVEANAGGIDIRGYVRLRVYWPPTTVGELDGKTPAKVEYFDCEIPAALNECANGVQDAEEVAVDCGYLACGGGCPDGSPCTIPLDCTSGDCSPDAMGKLLCVAAPCGDGLKTGTETCDDGNVKAGDGCSDKCQQEAGYTCSGQGPGSCIDINECELGIDTCDAAQGAVCENLPGSFTCVCGAGASTDGVGCFPGCGDGDKQSPEKCDDGNTSAGDGCNANCLIESGFECMGEGPGSCVDIDECKKMPSACLPTEMCHNLIPGFECNCDLAKAKVCSGKCISVDADVFNCGDCGHECFPNEVCTAGVCGPPPQP